MNQLVLFTVPNRLRATRRCPTCGAKRRTKREGECAACGDHRVARMVPPEDEPASEERMADRDDCVHYETCLFACDGDHVCVAGCERYEQTPIWARLRMQGEGWLV